MSENKFKHHKCILFVSDVDHTKKTLTIDYNILLL